jgi:riboflavin synthase
MFTGIVEETGRIEEIAHKPAGIRLVITAASASEGLKPGSSLAINGCCLTVVKIMRAKQKRRLTFDVLKETWDRTNLQFAVTGTLVNLERPLKAGDALGGHFVTGHVDGIGKLTAWEKRGQDHLLEVRASAALMRQIIFKGSIAIDGISLTVGKIGKERFSTWIIPHTLSITNLKQRQIGDAVNLETDMLGKYAQRRFSGKWSA